MIKGIILAFFGSIFPVVLFNIDRKKIIWTGFCGAAGWGTYLIIYNHTYSPVFASFGGTFVVGIYSEIMARVLKTPAVQFSIPGIFPLVPGITAYNTIRCIVEGDTHTAYVKGMETLSVAGAIAFGIMLSSTTFRYLSNIRAKGKNFNS